VLVSGEQACVVTLGFLACRQVGTCDVGLPLKEVAGGGGGRRYLRAGEHATIAGHWAYWQVCSKGKLAFLIFVCCIMQETALISCLCCPEDVRGSEHTRQFPPAHYCCCLHVLLLLQAS
jgi:hypothetical protein